MKNRPQRASGRDLEAVSGEAGDDGACGETSRLARLPSVDAVLGAGLSTSLAHRSRAAAVDAIRESVNELRLRLHEESRGGAGVDSAELTPESVAESAARRLAQKARPRLRRVVNATGIVLHTNLGRAWLAEPAIAAVVEAARGASNLEYDVEKGVRGDRDRLIEEHLCALTGAEAATVVNNNAAGVVLALHALARGREVVVSRGELVEIGGSFRIPDIMAASGAVLREVGTTNRTHPEDYRRAIGPDTALLMKVHTSNYRVVGFSASVDLAELRSIAADHADLHVIEDLGAGALVDLAALGVRPELVVGDRLRAGADLVLASGDKLLGGPQCGIVVGRAALVDRLRRDPLKRALRPDKLTLAALEATLRLYRFSATPGSDIPTLRYLLRPVEELRVVGAEAVRLLRIALGESCSVELVSSRAEAGSGSWPGQPIDSVAVAVRARDRSADRLAAEFRRGDPPVLGRIENDDFLLDLRLIEDPRDLVPNPVAG